MEQDIQNIELTYLTLDDYKELKQAMIETYETMPDSYWRQDHIKTLIKKFPEGQVVVKVDDEIAGCALSIIVDSDMVDSPHTYREMIGNNTFNTHNPDGDILYGIEVFIKPEYQGLRLGRRLYDYRKDLCEKLNLKAIVFGGRIPNYHKFSEEVSPKEYLDKVRSKEIHDPVLDFQLANDFRPVRIMRGYMRSDNDSEGNAILLRWDNIFYEKPSKEVKIEKSVVRLGIVQWQMRPYNDLDDLMLQVEYFVDALSGYKSDFVLFPEFFNAPLMAKYNHLNEPDAIREMTAYTPQIVQAFSQLAISYNVNIITGSMPEMVEGDLYNAGYLCQRDGQIDRYEKIHVTPDEDRVWAMKGGNTLRTYDTDCGKIGILICYDVEFPELSRILADEGMNILFVPFLTDTQNGYARVRNCAMSRAIENECYVAIAGCVGNLPKVHNMDIQYAQSMVLTPCDFPFPINGVKAETTPNTEMILIADVDLDLLRELHNYGAVQNLKNRRKDIYELKRV